MAVLDLQIAGCADIYIYKCNASWRKALIITQHPMLSECYKSWLCDKCRGNRRISCEWLHP